ncbi:unnamed protein product [Heterobilharzia americana]|nr:unnamed protein product [Heterobilharzia americana]
MPKSVHIDTLPRTPGGEHLDTNQINADEIEFDSEITIKSSLLRECKPGNPWFEEGDLDEDDYKKSKFVARQSLDLRKVRSEEAKIKAILSSPMVDSRPRRLSCSKSFSEDVENLNSQTPLRLSKYGDLVSSASRRLSRIIINRRLSLMETNHNNASFGKLNSHTRTPTIKCYKQDNKEGNPSTPEDKENVEPSKGDVVLLSTSMADQPYGDVANSFIRDPCSVSEFRLLADMETTRLTQLCGDWNCVMWEEGSSIPERAIDSIRAAVGKFEMAEKSLTEADSPSNCTPAPKTDINDLLGYWTLVAHEISLLDSAFERLRIWRDDFGWSMDHCPVTPARSEIIKHLDRPSKRLLTPRCNKSKKSRSVIKDDFPVNDQLNSSLSKSASTVVKTPKTSKSRPTKSRFARFLEAKKVAVAEVGNKVQRRRKSIIDVLSPLGLRPVNSDNSSSMHKANSH